MEAISWDLRGPREQKKGSQQTDFPKPTISRFVDGTSTQMLLTNITPPPTSTQLEWLLQDISEGHLRTLETSARNAFEACYGVEPPPPQILKGWEAVVPFLKFLMKTLNQELMKAPP